MKDIEGAEIISRRRRLIPRYDPFGFGVVEMLLRERTTLADGTMRSSFCTSITMTELKPESMGVVPNPSFTLNSEEAQELMDALWGIGLRPKEGSGSAGSLAATERHLEDMRSLVFKTKPKGSQ